MAFSGDIFISKILCLLFYDFCINTAEMTKNYPFLNYFYFQDKTGAQLLNQLKCINYDQIISEYNL